MSAVHHPPRRGTTSFDYHTDPSACTATANGSGAPAPMATERPAGDASVDDAVSESPMSWDGYTEPIVWRPDYPPYLPSTRWIDVPPRASLVDGRYVPVGLERMLDRLDGIESLGDIDHSLWVRLHEFSVYPFDVGADTPAAIDRMATRVAVHAVLHDLDQAERAADTAALHQYVTDVAARAVEARTAPETHGVRRVLAWEAAAVAAGRYFTELLPERGRAVRRRAREMAYPARDGQAPDPQAIAHAIERQWLRVAAHVANRATCDVERCAGHLALAAALGDHLDEVLAAHVRARLLSGEVDAMARLRDEAQQTAGRAAARDPQHLVAHALAMLLTERALTSAIGLEVASARRTSSPSRPARVKR